MKALILAAGNSKRMMPLSKYKPKCLIEINSKTMLAYQLDAIIQCNISELIIVIGYLGHRIVNYVKNKGYSRKVKITFVENKQFTETGSCYSLWCAREHIREGYIHFNSDLVFDPKLLKRLIEANYRNSIITDERRITETDMVRFLANDGIINLIDKSNEIESPDGVLVGPVRLSPEAVSILMNEIGKEIEYNHLKTACYLTLGKILDRIDLHAISCEDLFWQEFDTVEERKLYENKS